MPIGICQEVPTIPSKKYSPERLKRNKLPAEISTGVEEFFIKTDVVAVLGMLFLVGLESNLQLKLIPNNIRYKRPFKNSNLNIAIVSDNGELILNTLNKIEIPSEIIEDIKANKPKDNYYDEFQVLRITNGYAISKSFFTY